MHNKEILKCISWNLLLTYFLINKCICSSMSLVVITSVFNINNVCVSPCQLFVCFNVLPSKH
jgi:hypothetical protein